MRRIVRPTLAIVALLITAVTFVISSCEDDNNGVVPENKTPTAPTGQVSDITFYTADISGKLELSKDELKQSEFGLLLSTSDDVMAVNSTKYPIKKFDKDYSFTLSLDGLDSVTTYYYRSYIYFEGNYFYSDVQEFTTKSPLDIIQTGNIESDSCTVKTLIDSKNLLDHIQEYGISYGLAKAPIAGKDSTVTTGVIESDGKFTLSMKNIPYDTIVNYRAFVKIKDQIYYGPTLSFKGNTVRTGTINITDNTIVSHLKINDNYKELGICYGIDSIPLVSNQNVSVTVLNDSNNYKLKLVDIPFDTIVYYRAYVNTGSDIVYGDIKSFGGNTVTTGVIDTLTFQVQSSVRFNDGITEYGVCYSNSDDPNIYNKKVSVSETGADNNYVLTLTDIPFGTVYYRAYVIRDRVPYYGDVRLFEGNSISTGDFNNETLSTISSIKFSTNYTSLDLGVCYSNNEQPTIYDKKVSASSLNADNTYELQLRNIPFGTVYYRAYMMVDGYPQYGAVKSFEGNSIETGDFEDSTLMAKASLAIGINYDELILGICYGNNDLPTINDKRVYTNAIDSLNNYSVSLTEIPFGKVNYRAYMALDGNIYYGGVKQFEGNSITTGAYSEDSLSVTSSIRISNGYNKLDLGVCYSNNEQPTINDKKVTTNRVDSVNSFVLQLSDIPFGRVYYCSYMMLDGIVHYGEIMSFEGNEIITGTIDSLLNVGSKIKYNQRFYTKPITYGISYGYNNNPTINDISVITNDIGDKKEYTLALTDIIYGTTYYYRAFVNVDGETQYGSVKSFYLEWPVADVVDLGLSVNWASFNVGASRPEEYGYYYAWGETETKRETDYSSSWSTYKWCNGSNNTMTKYCNNSDYGNDGFTDTKITLDLEDDVAHVKWGGSWRMPTKAEQDELRNNCTWTWTTLNGVNGYLVTSNKTGYTDRFIFLPAAGERDIPLDLVGSFGFYWSSSLYTDDPRSAYRFFFVSNYVRTSSGNRDGGFSVRPVCP